jgi:hypothetical protein
MDKGGRALDEAEGLGGAEGVHAVDDATRASAATRRARLERPITLR